MHAESVRGVGLHGKYIIFKSLLYKMQSGVGEKAWWEKLLMRMCEQQIAVSRKLGRCDGPPATPVLGRQKQAISRAGQLDKVSERPCLSTKDVQRKTPGINL